MDSCDKTMLHLIDGLERVENTLLERRNQLVQATSMTFNVVLLGLVLAGFAYFMYVQYHSTAQQKEEIKDIPFEPQTWYSASRNVRAEDYGRQLQPFEIETGHGLQGSSFGGGPEAIY